MLVLLLFAVGVPYSLPSLPQTPRPDPQMPLEQSRGGFVFARFVNACVGDVCVRVYNAYDVSKCKTPLNIRNTSIGCYLRCTLLTEIGLLPLSLLVGGLVVWEIWLFPTQSLA